MLLAWCGSGTGEWEVGFWTCVVVVAWVLGGEMAGAV
jgi:hypothetical protein